MDKRRIIESYQKGILTREQCAQILGVEPAPLGILLGRQRFSNVADVAGVAGLAGMAALSCRTVHTRG